MRRRGELMTTPQWHRGRKYWVVKDPLTLRYFHLRDEEHALWESLDGETNLEELCRAYNRRFAPQRLTVARLRGFLARLHRDGLIVADAPGQGEELIKRDRRNRAARIRNAFTNFLAIRFPGVDPERFLRWADPVARRLIQPVMLLAVLALACAAGVLFAAQYEFFLAELPTLDSVLSAQRYGWLLVTLAAVKILHELAHAFACRRLGGECHEIGLMLLVFTPCLYCNVSDAWRLSSKWDRIAVSAAGMIAEVALASICTFLWWFSQPGLFHTLCMNIVIVCSVSTILINGNPLLRYDGYFILADLIEIPNMWQKSRAALSRFLSGLCLGVDTSSDPKMPAGQRSTLIAYAAASIAYRVFVLSVIVWVVYRFLLVHRLEAVARLFVLFLAAGMLAVPVRGAWRLWRDPLRRRDVRLSRLTVTLIVIGGLLVCVLFVPFPASVGGAAAVEAESATTVFVTQPGRLSNAVAPGTRVRRGDVIARLENAEIADDILKLQGELRRQKRRQDNLQSLRLQDARFAAEIPAVRERIADLRRRIAQRKQDADELVLRSPVDGIVLPLLRREANEDSPGRLEEWSGTPLDAENIGSYLDSATAVCQVGRADSFQVTALIPESAVEFVAVGQTATVVLEQHGGGVLSGEVVELAKLDLEDLPPRFRPDEFPSAATSSRRPELLNAYYRVRIALDENDPKLRHGSRGRVRISVDPQTLGGRLLRGLRGLFRFEVRQGL